MAYYQSHDSTKLGGCILAFISLSFLLSIIPIEYVDGRKIETVKNTGLVLHKGTVKTIESDNGDLIDCVDIYKQPAFDHPLLKSHTLQLKPSTTAFVSGRPDDGELQGKLIQDWVKNGECPEGTIPILRTHRYEQRRPSNRFTRHYSTQVNPIIELDTPHGKEYALVSLSGTGITYYGAHGAINVWNPATFGKEISVSEIWVKAGRDEQLNTVEAGWISDGYRRTGCKDLQCPGFVQTNRKFVLGYPIEPVSSYNGKQYDITITIFKNVLGKGEWWVSVGDQIIGYWPDSIFTSLKNGSDSIDWGGEIYNIDQPTEDHHSPTQMGSGHFSKEGYGKAGYFRNIASVGVTGALGNPEKLVPYVTKPSCYDIHVAEDKNHKEFGTHFYFGGPGCCN